LGVLIPLQQGEGDSMQATALTKLLWPFAFSCHSDLCLSCCKLTVQEFGSLTTSQLVEKVRGLQELAFQLGLEEGLHSVLTVIIV